MGDPHKINVIIYWCQVKLSKIRKLVHFFKFYNFYSVIDTVCIRILVNRLCEFDHYAGSTNLVFEKTLKRNQSVTVGYMKIVKASLFERKKP